MFTELMKTAETDDESDAETEKQPTVETPRDDLLPTKLEDLSEAGYNSHSYRFTDSEMRWLRRFCLRLSEKLDQPVAHNTLIRALFRLADADWRVNPEHNRILELLSRLLR
jgi:hypothetical protein